MLKKNVYLIFPAGYHGNYINWAINFCDLDQRLVTVENPLNLGNSQQLGGIGTTHLHTRIPTHQVLEQHLAWVIYNQPQDKRIYVLNTSAGSYNEHLVQNIKIIYQILQYDPDPVFVNIYDGDFVTRSYGIINCITKWPTYMIAKSGRSGFALNFDVFDCANNLDARNFFVTDDFKFAINQCVDKQALQEMIDNLVNWYQVRNKNQPHEVNSDTYNIHNYNLTDKLFEISCSDIVSDKFISWFENFLSISGTSSSWSTDHVKSFHKTYVDAQPNLHWFESFFNWNKNKKLDHYLCSHSIIQAQIIKKIFSDLEITVDPICRQQRWQTFYSRVRDPSWPDAPDEHDYYKLPNHIQHELINKFNYKQKPLEFISNSWQQMSLEEINNIYCHFIKTVH